MLYELISEDDYEGLPEEAVLRFVAFESICRANMTRFITQDTSPESDSFVRLQYMTTVTGAAEALGIEGIRYPEWLDNPVDGVTNFMLSVSREVAKIKLGNANSNKALSVRLGEKTRGRIEQQIQKLRDIINSETIPEAKRRTLLVRLDDLSVELSQQRVSFAKVMAVLAQVSVGVASGTTFFAEAPHAIATISSLLGIDKAAEESEAQRQGAPPKQKALPAPAKPSERFGRSNLPASRVVNIDDDIPF
jgi:uncharacterized protein (UPF0147 family)